MQDHINFTALAEALLSRIESLVPEWVPGGSRKGKEYWAHSPFRGERDPSFSVCMQGENAGKWSDHAGSERGNDLLALYKALNNHASMGAAAVAVAHAYGLEAVGNVKAPRPGSAPPPRALPPPPPPAPEPRERWTVISPCPENLPRFNFSHFHRDSDSIEHMACYQRDGVIYGYVVRARRSQGGKDVLPYSWCQDANSGALAWKNKQKPDARALYLPDGRSPGSRTVILVEGEKKADALHELLQAAHPDVYCIASWPGGCKAWHKADWSWLAGCTVLLWADCDAKHEPLPRDQAKGMDDAARALAQSLMPLLPEAKQPGMAAMLAIGAHLREVQGCSVSLLPIPAPGSVADGWDCADAIAEGWDAKRVLDLLGKAYGLPDALPPADVRRDDLASASAAAGGSGGDGANPPAGQLSGSGGMPDWLAPYFDFEKGRWRGLSRKVVIKALENDPKLVNIVALNEMSNNIEARLAWPWPTGKAGPLQEGADLMLGKYLSDEYGMPAIGQDALFQGIQTVAMCNSYHPVRDHLRKLRHDKKVRLGEWLQFALGYQKESTHPDLWEYLGHIGRCWLIGMVARVMEPGCKFDYMPILEGKGGLGKSTMLEIIAGKADWFSSTHFDISKVEKGNEQIQGLWLYEFGELAHFGVADVRLIKSFVSNKIDKYRPAYARAVASFPRQVVLTGSTNDRQYLRDRTGNRRFWPIPCIGKINLQWLAERRDQLFAEAVLAYESGESYFPSEEVEKRLFEPMQEERMVQSMVHNELDRLTMREGSEQGEGQMSKGITQLTKFITAAMVAKAMGSDVSKVPNHLASEIRSWFEEHGWAYQKKSLEGARIWGYVQPAVWPPKSDDDEQQRSVSASGPVPTISNTGGDDDPF